MPPSLEGRECSESREFIDILVGGLRDFKASMTIIQNVVCLKQSYVNKII